MSRPSQLSQPSVQPKNLSDRQLLEDLEILVRRDHRLEAELIAFLGEVDARRLYLEQAHPSMFHYCVAVLRFAEDVAYKRIAVARAARKHPELLAALEAGDLHLTAASLIAPHLGAKNTAEWLAFARHRSAQEIRQQIADRNPKPDPKASVRRAPRPRVVPRPASGANNEATAAPSEERILTAGATPRISLPASRQPETLRKARCEPLGAERYCIRFVADTETHAQLQELRSLLRPSIPDADVGKILARAIGVLLQQVRKQKIASCSSPRPARTARAARASKPEFEAAAGGEATAAKNPSRHIPAAIRREVWNRDGGRCTFRSPGGRQCGSSEYLEFHHQVPWARSQKHTTSNIALRCRAHNQYEAELAFGRESMVRFRRVAAGASDSQLDLIPVR